MKAVVFAGAENPLTLSELVPPEPGQGQLLLKVTACGICGSDIHAYQTSLVPLGTVFGHEFAGTVAAIGDDVNGDWQIGDRAIALGGISCGTCQYCLNGEIAACENIELIGFHRNGGYAEYVVAQAAGSVQIPEGVSDTQAALVEPLAVGLAAFRDCQLQLGGNILIIGAGVIGIAVAKWARFYGAEHIGVADLEPGRLERATEAGATVCIVAGRDKDPVKAFETATGSSPEVIVECAGRPMLQQLVDCAPMGAHLVSVGASMEAEPLVCMTGSQKKIRLTFSFGYTLEDFQYITRMLATGRLSTGELITGHSSLEDLPDNFAALMQPNNHCKIIIEP
jgi:(R,R)-butanediol dehydrogenase/meso-butanediol dehydrogenase/diacetyl reductase